MGVNAAAFFRYYLRQPEKTLANFLLPALDSRFACCCVQRRAAPPSSRAAV